MPGTHRAHASSSGRGHGRYAYTYSCNCGAKGGTYSSRPAAEAAARKHEKGGR